MKNERAISLMALIITIVVIIILAGVVGYNAIGSISQANRMDATEEMRNVEELVTRKKVFYMTEQYTPSVQPMTSNEIEGFFMDVADENKEKYVKVIDGVKNINQDEDVEGLYKFYQFTPSVFINDFEGDVTISKLKRTYIVNFGLGTIISPYDGDLDIVGEVPEQIDTASDIVISFNPNGGDQWQRAQKTRVSIIAIGSSPIDFTKTKYKWSTETVIPDESTFTDLITTNPQDISLTGETGSWYLWVLAKTQNGKTKIAGRMFNIDNTAPMADVTVE